MTKMC